ncbi:MAG: hypothetical protein M3N39_00750, partial [Pseudomonadota bacterium]|nr:hypothetical protein [Pseudomonadota bacterium]
MAGTHLALVLRQDHEAAPTPYQLARIDALERELKEVEDAFARLKAGDAQRLSVALIGERLPAIDFAAAKLLDDDARGGPASALANGLVGTRYYG